VSQLVTVGTAARQTGLSAKAVRLCVRVVVTDQGAVPADLVILGLGCAATANSRCRTPS